MYHLARLCSESSCLEKQGVFYFAFYILSDVEYVTLVDNKIVTCIDIYHCKGKEYVILHLYHFLLIIVVVCIFF